MIHYNSILAVLIIATSATGLRLAVADDAQVEAKQDATSTTTPRAPWSTSHITGSPEVPLAYSTERVFPDLRFELPTDMSPAPGTKRLFITEMNGSIYSFLPDGGQPDLFLDTINGLKQDDRLFAITFHPDFERNRYCYISYDMRKVADGRRVSRFTVSDTEPPRCDAASEKIIISWTPNGHAGGSIKFGPDGFLYITAGDGGSAFPPDGNNTGQDISDIPSSILRIDVDHSGSERPYSVPDDNPFVGVQGARPEIWAYGLRNPWRISFDPFSGDLWTGDVGWELWEMVYRVQRGANYGWSVKEGRQPVRSDLTAGPSPILPPTIEHPHTEALSITGGYTYRGTRLPELSGAYIYADYITGKIWGARHDGQQVTWNEELADSALAIVSFGEDNDGHLFMLDHAAGTIHRLVANPRAGQNSNFPTRLSDTGLFASVADHLPATGVVPYSQIAEPWQDYATFDRMVALPGTSTIITADKKNRRFWEYPKDSVFARTVSIEMERGNPNSARRLETQILHYDGHAWKPYTYIWNDEQTDGVLADASGEERLFEIIDTEAPGGIRKQKWRFASRAECTTCHTFTAGHTIGFHSAALETGFDGLGIVDHPFASEIARMHDPHDKSATLDQRARSYLHANCAHCHRRGGGGNSPIELVFTHQLKRMRTIGALPTQGTFGIANSRLIQPGDPYSSMLYMRMSKLGSGRMPHLSSNYVDRKGVELIAKWIESLSPATREGTDDIRPVPVSLTSPESALRTIRRIDQGQIDVKAAEAIISQGVQHPDPVVISLFERFIPEDERIERLGQNIDIQHLLSVPGDPTQGRRIFFERSDVQCRSCHTIDGRGTAIGPDLSGVGKKYAPSQILENLLEPSKSIDPKFVTHMVLTIDGEVVSGILAERTDREVVIRDAQNKVVHIALDDIESIKATQTSIMPAQLLRDMTAQEAADLLAFLLSCKSPENGEPAR